VLGSAAAAATEAAAALAAAATQGVAMEGGVLDLTNHECGFTSPVKLLSAAMDAQQAMTLEECDRLLRQYASTIATLERAVPDLQVCM
jgi:hypothetical protein